ncbi:MAG: ribonuclease Z [Flavobacteriaceae bacterium]
MKLTILGCHSATPRKNAHTTSQLLEVQGHLFLIDCGEGTQMQLRKAQVKFARIKHIFISHLHGDHFYGLVGLISTFRLLGRTAPLHIYGPKGIKDIIVLQLKLANSWTDYELYFHELEAEGSQLIFENEKLSVLTIPLNHRIYTNGFLFQEKAGLRQLNREALAQYEIPVCDFEKIKAGSDYTLADGTVISNVKLSFSPKPVHSYAFCSDTAYHESIIPLVKGVEVLYHEATFLQKHADLAAKTKHSTAQQAAKIAQQAGVHQLILGHFSSRYKNHDLFLTEAQKIFTNTDLAEDLKTFDF